MINVYMGPESVLIIRGMKEHKHTICLVNGNICAQYSTLFIHRDATVLLWRPEDNCRVLF